MLKHHKGYFWCFNVAIIHQSNAGGYVYSPTMGWQIGDESESECIEVVQIINLKIGKADFWPSRKSVVLPSSNPDFQVLPERISTQIVEKKNWRESMGRSPYLQVCVGGIHSGCSRHQNSSLFHVSVDQAPAAGSVLWSNCSLLSLDVAIRHSRKLWIKNLGKSPLTGS